MESILQEIDRAAKAGMFYVAVAMTLTLPDMCAALEAVDGRTSNEKYRAWCDIWLRPIYPNISSADFYSMRCGIIHQGSLGLTGRGISRVLFTIPDYKGNFIHNNIFKTGNDTALNLDASRFCQDVAEAVRK